MYLTEILTPLKKEEDNLTNRLKLLNEEKNN